MLAARDAKRSVDIRAAASAGCHAACLGQLQFGFQCNLTEGFCARLVLRKIDAGANDALIVVDFEDLRIQRASQIVNLKFIER